MAWTYEAPNRNVGYSDSQETIIWDNEWTLTELSPDRAGYIKLQLSVTTTHFEYYRNGVPHSSYDGSKDTISYGGSTIVIRERSLITSNYTYTKQFYIPSSWAGKTVHLNVAWRQVDLVCGASATYSLSISVGNNTTLTVLRKGVQLTQGAVLMESDVLTVSASAITGYIAAITINGVSFASGDTYAVSGDVFIASVASVQTYQLSIDQGANTTITVNRVNSPYGGAAQGYLSNGATLYQGDEISVSYSASTGYSVTTHTVNGSDFDSGLVITVADSIAVITAATLNTYNISVDIGEHLTLSVQRTSSPLGGGRTGSIMLSEDIIYHGDVLVIAALPGSGYGVDSMTVNGDPVSSPYTVTIVSSLIITILEKALGFLYIDSGSAIEKYKIIIDSGSALDQYRAMIDTGSAIVPY